MAKGTKSGGGKTGGSGKASGRGEAISKPGQALGNNPGREKPSKPSKVTKGKK